VILPVVLEDYGSKVWKKLARLAEVSGVALALSTTEEKAKAFINAIYDMNAKMGLPEGFDFIKSEHITQMITWASKESNPIYPVPVVYDKVRFRKVIEMLRTKEGRTYKIGESCTGCTACTRVCPVFAIAGERGKRHEINALRCVECGVCGRICPSAAINDSNGKSCTAVKRPLWPKPSIDPELCSACGICVQDCTPRALNICKPKFRGDIKVYAELSAPEKCVACALCEKHCPMGAVVMVSRAPAAEAPL